MLKKLIFTMVFVLCALPFVTGLGWVERTVSLNWDSGKQTEQLFKNWQKLRKRGLRLLPVPKVIEFTGEKILIAGEGAGRTVVVLAKESKKGKIAANEIVSRIKELSPQTEISVVSRPTRGAFNIVIENHQPNWFTKSEKPSEAEKTDQAYGIKAIKDGVKLAGMGEMGMMYAAVTLRYLIEKDGDNVVLHQANVVDWPDYKNRQVGNLLAPYHTRYINAPEKHLKNMKPHIDWLFRMKSTGVFHHTMGQFHHGVEPGRIASNRTHRRSAKLVSEYALKRGIKAMTTGGGGIRQVSTGQGQARL